MQMAGNRQVKRMPCKLLQTLQRLKSGKKYQPFEEVKDEEPTCISVRWVVTEKVNAQLVARGS